MKRIKAAENEDALFNAVHEYLVAEMLLKMVPTPQPSEVTDEWRALNKRFMNARDALISEHDRIAVLRGDPA